jgi:hypothetical protein
VVPVHCAELQPLEELLEELPVDVLVVVVVVVGLTCGNGSFSQETNNIEVNTIVISNNFFIMIQRYILYLTMPNFFLYL